MAPNLASIFSSTKVRNRVLLAIHYDKKDTHVLTLCLDDTDNPKHAHAEALILVKDFDEEFARVDIVSFCRVAKMVKKQFLFASVQAKDEPKSNVEPKDGSRVAMQRIVYISVTHALLASRHEERDLA